ncbi:hypothetical protein ES708_31417 [subsurface metagenome]
MIFMPRKVIAHGVKSLQVPGYLTVKTGIHSPDPMLVDVSIKYGNTEEQLGLFEWTKMHGVRVTYRKDGALKIATIYDDHRVTMRVTGEWKVEVEPPE